MVNDTWAKWGFEIWPLAIIVIFWSIFGDRIANLGLIDFEIGLYIKANVNAGQDKFKVHIYQFAKNAYQMAQNRPEKSNGDNN